MGFLELFLIALGLAMDAFAVAVCKGLGMRRATPRKMVLVGLYFGLFQAGMPLVGYFVGVQFSSAIRSVDHWIAFGLLSVIGVNMLKEAVKGCAGCSECDAAGTGADLSVRSMTALAVATSIDALAVGVGFAFLNTPILPAAACIGIVAFFLSMQGVKIGNLFGAKFKSKAEIAGGLILILMGVKILLEHLDVL